MTYVQKLLNFSDQTTQRELSLVARGASDYRLPSRIVAFGHVGYGVLINHQESLGLTEMDVGNRHLPAYYSDEFHPATTRLSVILADLHSGRFFGARGNLISDAVALMVFISIGTGVYSFFLRRSASSAQQVENGYAAEERRKPEERLVAHIPIKPALEVIDKTAVLTASESTTPQKRAVAQASAITSERPLSQPVDR